MNKFKLFFIILLSFGFGLYCRNYTLFYSINCDTNQFSGHWGGVYNDSNSDYIECLHTNIKIGIEKDPVMVLRLMKSNFTYFIWRLTNE